MKDTLERLVAGEHLSQGAAEELLIALTDESVPPPLAAAVLIALRAKGETAEEVRGFAAAMRGLALRPELPDGASAVDVVGTGGDGSGSLNLSTGAALLAAACGRPVVKHGNRAVSSRSGSADLLEALGLDLPLDEAAAGRCLDEVGFTFLFAPYYHPAMRTLAGVRRALGVRTVFNLLGPLTNPAAPPYAVLGAWSPAAAALMAETVAGLPIERVFVLHGMPGWDEATPCGPFLLYDVHPGRVERVERDPADLGFPRCDPQDLAGGDATENARRIRDVFGGERGPHRDALVLGAALALEVSGASPDDAIEAADAVLATGRAASLLERMRAFSEAEREGARRG